jgi:nitroreductase
MNILDSLYNNRSIRKFTDEDVDQKSLDKILEAAVRTSTTGNMQVYSIIVTREAEKRKALLPFHFNQQMVAEAPVVLTFNADFNRFNKWCELRGAKPGYDNFLSFMTAATDALIAAQNAAVAAEALGLGICYLGTTIYMAEGLIEHFNLPKGVVPLTTLVIGHPAENPPLTDRLPVDAVIHNETYRDYSNEEIERIYHEKENMPFYQELVKENEVESLAHVFTEKRYTQDTNITFSKKLLQVLVNQGFLNH